VSPTEKWYLSAVFLSIAISLGPVGQRPAAMRAFRLHRKQLPAARPENCDALAPHQKVAAFSRRY